MTPFKRLSLGGALVAIGVATLLVPRERGDARRWEGAQLDAYDRWYFARRESAAYRRIQERAVIRELAQTLRAVPVQTPLVRFDPRVPAGAADQLRATIASELSAANANPPRHALAVIVVVDTGRLVLGYRRAVVLPGRGEEPCTVVLTVALTHAATLTLSPTDRLLGTCAFYAAYGAPGAATAAWLRESRAASAQFLQLPSGYTGSMRRRQLDAGFTAEASCRAGRREACLTLFAPSRGVPIFEDQTPAESLESTAVPGTQSYWTLWYLPEEYLLQPGMLGALASELGPQHFGELWRSDRTIADSYRARAGRPFEEWLYEYIAARTLPYSAGPGIGALAWILASGLVVLAVAATLRRTPRVIS